MMRKVPIGQLVEAVSTWNPQRVLPPTSFRYIDIGAIDQVSKRVVAAREIDSTEAPSRARQLVKATDVLVSTVRPNLNAVAEVPEALDGATASTGFCVLRPGPELVASYLFYWVRSPAFIADMTRKATGQSYPAVSDKIVMQSEMPWVPVEEQRKVAGALGQVEHLQGKRLDGLTALDELAQSIFFDMFGDVALNDRGWDNSCSLGDVSDIVSGITKGRKAKGPFERIPYLAVVNVQDMRLDLTTVKDIDATSAEIEKYRLQRNDLLLTEGGDPDKLGRGTLWQEELPLVIHQNHIFRVRLRGDSGLDPVFLNWLVGSERGRRYFPRSAKQTTGIASINATQLRQFPLLVPPLDFQREFAARIAKLESQKAVHKSHLATLDALFASLQYRAFQDPQVADDHLWSSPRRGKSQRQTVREP
jgi:type I restriction enzyme, S subunit